MSCELWCRLAATAPNPPLDWELPYAARVAPTKKKKKTEEKNTFLGLVQYVESVWALV